MIQLVPMTEADFHAYCQHAIAEYAEEHVRAGSWSADEADAQAQRQYQELLPDGVATANHYLYTVCDVATEAAVGLLWFAVQEESGQRAAFVYDVAIDPACRRQGYATQTFRALEDQVRALGLNAIRLHVFGHNHAARALYEQLGFVATNIIMAKTLDER